MLLSGSPPFYGKTDSDTLQSVKSGRWRFDESFRQVSEEAKDFITQCLSRRASKRPSAMGALKHSWFKLLMEPDQKNGKTLDIVSRLRKFTKRSSFAKVCMEVVAHTLLPEQISDLRKDFAKLDISNTGEITFSDLRKVLEGNGKFTVEDLSYIFNGIDWEQTGKISYHEFIAASLTTKEITEENMRVAFEKISSHADYITSDNIVDILGSDGSKEEVGNMLKELHLDTSSKITYNQVRIMVHSCFILHVSST